MAIDHTGARKLGEFKSDDIVAMQIAVRHGLAIRDGRIMTIVLVMGKPMIHAVRPASPQEIELYTLLKMNWG